MSIKGARCARCGHSQNRHHRGMLTENRVGFCFTPGCRCSAFIKIDVGRPSQDGGDMEGQG